MPATRDLTEAILAAWRTNHQVTVFLVRNVPTAVWAAPLPGAPRKTVRMLAGHLHNARNMSTISAFSSLPMSGTGARSASGPTCLFPGPSSGASWPMPTPAPSTGSDVPPRRFAGLADGPGRVLRLLSDRAVAGRTDQSFQRTRSDLPESDIVSSPVGASSHHLLLR